jgi:hypothetical protein
MPLIRLLVLAWLALPLLALAQSEVRPTEVSPVPLPAPGAHLPPTLSEPSAMVSSDASSTTSALDPARFPQSHPSEAPAPDPLKNGILEDLRDPTAALRARAPASLAPAPYEFENTCYAIRSYVVARDEKDSDSTHLVHYSVCQPANRYRLRTAQMETQSSTH